MSLIESMIERRHREVFTSKTTAEFVDVEIIIKDKQGRVLTNTFKDCMVNQTARTFENDGRLLELDFTITGDLRKYSRAIK
jgi:hypothetical protein